MVETTVWSGIIVRRFTRDLHYGETVTEVDHPMVQIQIGIVRNPVRREMARWRADLLTRSPPFLRERQFFYIDFSRSPRPMLATSPLPQNHR